MKSMKSFFLKCLAFIDDRLIVYLGNAACVTVFLLVALVVISVIGRWSSTLKLDWSYDVQTYLLLAMISLGLSYTLKVNQHIRVDFMTMRLPGKIKRDLGTFTQILSLFFLGVATWACWVTALNSFHSGKATMSVQLPLYLPQGVLAIGFTIFFLAQGLQIYLHLKRPGQPVSRDSASELVS